MSKLWSYIKERKLQNPLDKRVIMTDEKLKTLFKTDKIKMFDISKMLVKHIYSKEPQDDSSDDD